MTTPDQKSRSTRKEGTASVLFLPSTVLTVSGSWGLGCPICLRLVAMCLSSLNERNVKIGAYRTSISNQKLPDSQPCGSPEQNQILKLASILSLISITRNAP